MSAQSNDFAGGYRRDAISRVILWAVCHGLICGSVQCALVSKPSPVGVGLGGGGGARQTITTYLWLTGATTVKHFSRFYVFLGGALYQARWQLWARIIRWRPSGCPRGAHRTRRSTTRPRKKRGARSKASPTTATVRARRARNIARCGGSTLCGGSCACRCRGGPSTRLSVPIGLSLYLKEEQARPLQLPYQSRSALAREIVDFVAAQLPARPIRVLGDGGYATKECLRKLPATVHVVSRMLITGKLYAPPPQPAGPRRGCPPKKVPYWAPPKPLRVSATAGSPIPPKRGPWSKRGLACGISSSRDA